MAWAIALAAALSAGATYWSGEQAKKASEGASDENVKLARENRNIALQMYEPTRALGYGATADLAHLYGYTIPQYVSSSALGAGGGAGGTPGVAGSTTPTPWITPTSGGLIKVDGRAKRSDKIWGIDANPFRSENSKKFGGYINPATGEVFIPGNPEGSAKATEYLRTGGGLKKNKNPKFGRIMKEIRLLQQTGWSWDPNTNTPLMNGEPIPQAPGSINPAAPGTSVNPAALERATTGQEAFTDPNSPFYAGPNYGNSGFGYTGEKIPSSTAPGANTDLKPPAATGGTSSTAPNNFSRFFTSPDYQWRLSESGKAIERSAAARGGLYSGRTGVRLVENAQNQASQEYGNYFERLMRMSGMGGAATNSSVNAIDLSGRQMMDANTQAGQARSTAYQQTGDTLNNLLSNLYYAYARRGG